MPHKTFFEKFDQFADAPGAVAKMRELVLHLAVTGKLVPQDPKDESAENLCEPDDELTASSWFEIPHKWVWVRLTMLADINGGFAFKSSGYTDEGIRVIRISDFDEFGFKDHKVVRHPFTPDLHKFTLAQSNILMAMTGGTVGKSYLVRMLPEPMVVNQRVATIKVSDSVIPSYIDIVIRSEITQEAIRKAKNSTNDNISMGDIKGFAIPLPPLAEQKRIVAKVDELMALCDRLEAQQQERDQKQTALARASLARFADAPTPANLELLFYPSAPRLQLPAPRSQLPAPSSARPLHSPSSFLVSPADLRKSILTLAVQGKLVPQDPNDEPAEEFLLRTKARHALPRGSKARKTNGSMEIAADEIPFVIPESWAWCRLETIADKVTDGEHLSPVKTASGMPLLTATHVTAKGVTLNNPQYVGCRRGARGRLGPSAPGSPGRRR